MNNNFKIISYYTENTVYEDIANTHLIESLKKTDLDYEVTPVKSAGNWYLNTSMKPKFIYFNLCNSNKDLIWIDVDAKIMQPCTLFQQIPDNVDIALHYLDWSKQYNRPKDTTKELLTGTVFFRNSLKVKELVNKWAVNSMNNTSIWEQKILESLLKKSDLVVYDLPVQYCAIIDAKGNVPKYIKDPVIVHYQASRSVKKHDI